MCGVYARGTFLRQGDPDRGILWATRKPEGVERHSNPASAPVAGNAALMFPQASKGVPGYLGVLLRAGVTPGSCTELPGPCCRQKLGQGYCLRPYSLCPPFSSLSSSSFYHLLFCLSKFLVLAQSSIYRRMVKTFLPFSTLTASLCRCNAGCCPLSPAPLSPAFSLLRSLLRNLPPALAPTASCPLSSLHGVRLCHSLASPGGPRLPY